MKKYSDNLGGNFLSHTVYKIVLEQHGADKSVCE